MRTVGAGVVIFLAAARGAGAQLHEAATVDGASPWQRLRWIRLRMISPSLFSDQRPLKPRSRVFDNKLIPERLAPHNYVDGWHAVPLCISTTGCTG